MASGADVIHGGKQGMSHKSGNAAVAIAMPLQFGKRRTRGMYGSAMWPRRDLAAAQGAHGSSLLLPASSVCRAIGGEKAGAHTTLLGR